MLTPRSSSCLTTSGCRDPARRYAHGEQARGAGDPASREPGTSQGRHRNRGGHSGGFDRAEDRHSDRRSRARTRTRNCSPDDLSDRLGSAPATEPQEQPPVEETVAAHTRPKPVRKPLPADLPRVQIEIVPHDVEREPGAFELIGTDVRAVLEHRPSATVVVEILYKKFVRKERIRGVDTEVFVSDALELPIERGMAGPGTLADTIVRRWQGHQPVTQLVGI
jgi:transposase